MLPFTHSFRTGDILASALAPSQGLNTPDTKGLRTNKQANSLEAGKQVNEWSRELNSPENTDPEPAKRKPVDSLSFTAKNVAVLDVSGNEPEEGWRGR